MMTDLFRGARVRRGGRRPGWMLLSTLLVLAIVASSALVFTSRVELLKLAIVVALWAAVVAAFVSVTYRRQSEVDQARVRDLKLVYDLQLDREISARREYELTVESQLRRELASELRAQVADEVAALRAELAALRTNLEILFDTDLDHRPALETERTTIRAYSDWARSDGDSTSDTRVLHTSQAVYPDGSVEQTTENPIIDVPEVGVPAGGETTAPPASREPATVAPDGHAGAYRGSHRRASDNDTWSAPEGGRRRAQEGPRADAPPHVEQGSRHEPGPQPEQWAPEPVATAPDWQPAAAEGQWVPPGAAGSNWVADSTPSSGGAAEPAPEPRHGRHTGPPVAVPGPVTDAEPPRQRRNGGQRAHIHSPEPVSHRAATMPSAPQPELRTASDVAPSQGARHAGTEPGSDDVGLTGGQSVADLLARLQPGATGGRRRRRREE